jgi:hypothetical protein
MVKRGILFFIATIVTITQSFAFAVTFQVDMSSQTVSPTGVHIAGSFADANSDGTIDNPYPNWDPSVLALTSLGNGIWSITLDLAAGSYEYKFINGNVWDITEFFPADAPCVQGTFGNRSITVANANEILPVVCWNECVACGQGCTDPTACNYDAGATLDGPCTYPNFIPTIIIDQPSLGCFSNGVRIYPSGGAFAQIGWGTSFGSITSVSDTLIIYGNVSQDFYFIGTEPSGCVVNIGPLCVNVNEPTPVSICLVTVDDASGKNHIIWEPIANSAVQSIVVFKETNAINLFEEIGEVDYLSAGTFQDQNSNPQVQSNRYRIAMRDICGYLYAPLDGIHKTIHLTTTPVLGNNVNLNWNAYEGIAFDSYNIYRGANTGSMNLIATVASNVFSYTDLNPPIGEVNYMIEVVGVSCDPSRNLVYSRSNILDLLAQNVSEELNSTLQIFPNPASTQITFQLNESDLGASVFIYNALGQEVLVDRLNAVNQTLNIEKLSEGFYFIIVEGRVVRLQIVK